MTDYCLTFDDDACNTGAVELVGGKNASLGELTAAGVPVPPGFAVTTAFYERFLNGSDLSGRIDRHLAEVDHSDTDEVERASQLVREEIKSEPFPEDLVVELSNAWDALVAEAGSNNLAVAVRSSATAEDRPDASFAGQQDTYLNVTGFDSVQQKVRECMASLYTARAISYRKEQEFDYDDVSISVGVQKLIEARSAGVMFTLNPTNGDRSKIYLEAAWGLGEGVVSGSVTPDGFLIDKPLLNVAQRDVKTKSEMIVSTDDGVKAVKVDLDRRNSPAVSDDEIADLAEFGKQIERQYGTSQDIEWVIEEGTDEIYIVQSRPETTWNDEIDDDSETSDDQSTSSTDILGTYLDT
jgi:pyruvate,water dikinase